MRAFCGLTPTTDGRAKEGRDPEKAQLCQSQLPGDLGRSASVKPNVPVQKLARACFATTHANRQYPALMMYLPLCQLKQTRVGSVLCDTSLLTNIRYAVFLLKMKMRIVHLGPIRKLLFQSQAAHSMPIHTLGRWLSKAHSTEDWCTQKEVYFLEGC